MMKKLLQVFSCLIIFLSLWGCGNELLTEISRVSDDPFIEVPAVVSFTREGLVKVSWTKDPGADFYILEKREDGSSNTKECYRGTGNYFEDEIDALDHGKIFLYTLTKVRGSKKFGPYGAVIGVGENAKNDAYEPNNSEKTAVFMDRELEGNIFYYRANTGEVLQDEDWFYLEVAPRTRVHIKIYQSNIYDGTETYFFFNRDGETASIVTSGNDYVVSNTKYTPDRIYIRISPRPAKFATGLYNTGGSIVNYRITPHQRDLMGAL